jgi:hypothetical protein
MIAALKVALFGVAKRMGGGLFGLAGLGWAELPLKAK